MNSKIIIHNHTFSIIPPFIIGFDSFNEFFSLSNSF